MDIEWNLRPLKQREIWRNTSSAKKAKKREIIFEHCLASLWSVPFHSGIFDGCIASDRVIKSGDM